MLLVPEIHPINVWLFWILSYFFRVGTGRIHPLCPRRLSRRFKLFTVGNMFHWSEVHCFRAEVLQKWEKVVDRIPTRDWSVRFRGRNLDLSLKARQELGQYFERSEIMERARQQAGSAQRAVILDSAPSRYLQKVGARAERSVAHPGVRMLSAANVLTDIVFLQLTNLVYAMWLALKLVRGIAHRAIDTRLERCHITCLWDGINPNELSLDSTRRYFPWIVDATTLTTHDILYLLPEGLDPAMRAALRGCPLQACTATEAYASVWIPTLVATIFSLAARTVLRFARAPLSFSTARSTSYLHRILRIDPITRRFQPSFFVTSISVIGSEDPATLYLNQIGIRTIMYAYGANSYLFGTATCRCDFRLVQFASILASRFLVWHEEFKRFVESHPQQNVQVTVIGPLMPGDESVMRCSPPDLRYRFNVRCHDRAARSQFLSCFDVAPVSKEYFIANDLPPEPYTEEYAVAFMRDMLRLLRDFDDLYILYKPKRSLTKAKFSYAPEFRDLIARLAESERGLIVDDDINPWVPIALADICVGMPFTSPPLAGMHYGIPGLFHDPLGLAQRHRYSSMAKYITYNYEQLRSAVLTQLAAGTRDDRDRRVLWSEVRDFIGICPGQSSSDLFRTLLANSGNKEIRK